jgi:uncharacterized protein YuzE
MKITYDSRYNVAYIHFREAIEPVKTIEVSGEMNVDIAPDGTIYGIELLNANEQLGADQNASLTVINEALGEASEIKLMLR